MFMPTIVALFATLSLVAAAGDAVYQKRNSAVVRKRGSSGHQDEGRPHRGGGKHGKSCRPHDGGHDLVDILLKHHAQEFCSTFLHLPTTATATTTQTVVSDAFATTTVTATSDPGTTTVTSTSISTEVDTTTTTFSETTTTQIITSSVTTTTTTTVAQAPVKRSLPSWLQFPESKISSACSQIVTPTTTSVTATITTTSPLTITTPTTVTTTLPLQTETTVTETTTTSTVTSVETTEFTARTTTTTTSTSTATVTLTADCFKCPPEDQLGFPVGQHNEASDPIFCSYPAVEGEDPNDFFCRYSATTGVLVQDNDAGLCVPNAVNTCSNQRREVEGRAEARAAQPLTSRAKIMAARSGVHKMKRVF